MPNTPQKPEAQPKLLVPGEIIHIGFGLTAIPDMDEFLRDLNPLAIARLFGKKLELRPAIDYANYLNIPSKILEERYVLVSTEVNPNNLNAFPCRISQNAAEQVKKAIKILQPKESPQHEE